MTTRAVSQDEDVRRPKRGHGEGSIHQREDGVWVGRIMLGRRADGRPDRPKVTGKTRGDVQRQLAELRRKADQGMRADPAKERQTVAAYLEDWLCAQRSATRPRTYERYGQIIRLHIAPTLGRTKLGALRPDAIQTLYADKLAEGLAPRTVDKIHVVLHRAFKMAVRWGYLPRNPADAVDKPRAPRHDVRPPEGAELVRLIEAPDRANDRLAALWTLAIHTGCRQGELLGLCWQDVDLETGKLTVRRTLQGVKGTVPQFGEPKSETSRRDLRHAHATLMLRAGVPLKVASGRLGHDSIGITADLYQHVAQDLDAEAAERAAAAMLK